MPRESAGTLIDLFCGCGGLTEGFAASGWQPVFAVDSDGDSVRSYRANFGDVAVNADIRDVSFRGMDADIVVSGIPCQGYTLLGRRSRRHDPRNGLFREFLRALKKIRPRLFLVEEVPAFLGWWSGRQLIREARKMGYGVSSRILDAWDFGVPQRRRRAFIIGSRDGPLTWPEPTPLDDRLAVIDAIGDLPAEISWHGMDRTSRSGDEVLNRIRHIPPGGSRLDLPRELQLPCWRDHLQGSRDVMGRLRWDLPAVSIRCEFIKPEKGRYIHPEADRSITLREGARLQSFRDRFLFRGGLYSVAHQIGNAVPPELARRIAQELAE